MDIIVKTVLDFIQSKENASNSVLAGGAVRDHIYNLEPRDYDIFVPAAESNKALIKELNKEFKLNNDIKKKGKVYGSNTSDIGGVFEFNFEGKSFDVIFKCYENDEDFGNNVIDGFDYGVNMVYYNGLYVEDSNKHFEFDRNSYSMSLIKIDNLSCLPKAMKRYYDFCEKSKMNLNFRAPCLEVVGGEKKQEKRFKIKNTTGMNIWDEPAEPRVGEARPWQAVDELPVARGPVEAGVNPGVDIIQELRRARQLIDRNAQQIEPLRVFNPAPVPDWHNEF